MKGRLIFYGSVLVLLLVAVFYATYMPGKSHSGALPEATPALRDLERRLRGHVTALAGTIGTRSLDRAEKLDAAREYIVASLKPLETSTNRVQLEDVGAAGGYARNVIFEVAGKDQSGVIVVGAHYDSVDTGPGANDNGSGVAATLELAANIVKARADRNVRFVWFVNEEAPYFKNPGMGSLLNAERARNRGDRIIAMLSLETLGYYTEAPDTQHYPFPVGLLYPSRGNFLAFVGDLGSRSLVRSAIGAFREAEQFPTQGAALPTSFPGIDWSDHWSFRRVGYPAIMLTDTAPYRDPNYHKRSDRPDALNYASLARVTRGIEAVVRRLASRD